MKKSFYFIAILLFLIYLCIFMSSSSSYNEYYNNKKTVFTEEKIKEFEKDVAEGKNVNIKDYIENDSKDYTNKITRLGDKVSNFINDSVNLALKGGYKIIEKMIN